MNQAINVGDYVRNTASGKFGCIAGVSPDIHQMYNQTIEVIGNIHDNPEMSE